MITAWHTVGGQSMWVTRYFICASNIVRTPFTSDVGNNTRSHCTKRLWYTVHYKMYPIESYKLIIVFFEKAIITGLPLQNKQRTYKKGKEKNNVRAFFQSVGLGPPQPPNPTEISGIRAWIYVSVVVEERYRSLIPSIVLPRSNDMFTFACL